MSDNVAILGGLCSYPTTLPEAVAVDIKGYEKKAGYKMLRQDDDINGEVRISKFGWYNIIIHYLIDGFTKKDNNIELLINFNGQTEIISSTFVSTGKLDSIGFGAVFTRRFNDGDTLKMQLMAKDKEQSGISILNSTFEINRLDLQ